MVFRGTALGAAQFVQIQHIIDSSSTQGRAAEPGGGRSGPHRTRQEIARETCRLFKWRSANGVLAVRAARELLVRLERGGVVRLPAPRRRQGRPSQERVEAATRLIHEPSSGAWQAPVGATLIVRPVCSGSSGGRADEQLWWRAHMERFHYLGDAAVVGESIRYAAFLAGELVALLGFGAASLHNRPRDRQLGWDEATKKRNLHLVVNNVRFLMLPWIRGHNLASRVLGATLRRLSRDWQAVYGHRVVLAETFVDTSRFLGTCYRASNWLCVGETRGFSKSGYQYRFNGRPKSVWLYPLSRDFKKDLCAPLHEPRKEGGFMILDVERLPLYGEGGLFEILHGIPDARKARGIRHKIESLLAIAVCATLAGARSITAIAEWAAEQTRETLKMLGSKRRPPSERTFRRLFDSVDVEELDRGTGEWVARQQQLAGDALAIDGKTLRGSRDGDSRSTQGRAEAGGGRKNAVHLLSAIVHGSGTVVAQVPVDVKTNEITQVKPLLENLDIAGVVVTADALHTQKDTATYIVKEKHADYVFTVKDNQATLRQDIEDLGLDATPPSAHHGRQGPRAHRDAGDLDKH